MVEHVVVIGKDKLGKSVAAGLAETAEKAGLFVEVLRFASRRFLGVEPQGSDGVKYVVKEPQKESQGEE